MVKHTAVTERRHGEAHSCHRETTQWSTKRQHSEAHSCHRDATWWSTQLSEQRGDTVKHRRSKHFEHVRPWGSTQLSLNPDLKSQGRNLCQSHNNNWRGVDIHSHPHPHPHPHLRQNQPTPNSTLKIGEPKKVNSFTQIYTHTRTCTYAHMKIADNIYRSSPASIKRITKSTSKLASK